MSEGNIRDELEFIHIYLIENYEKPGKFKSNLS